MASLIELKKVSFTVQNQPIVKKFSCQFEEGKSTAIIGPSGCGKSTVLKLCAGILVPVEGEVLYREKDVFSMNQKENLEFRREAAMVFQDSALWANQSLSQILELPLRIHFPDMSTEDMKKRMNDVLYEVGYRKELAIRPSKLSMGEQKLIGFARAMMCKPKLLFLDEWTESLDDTASQRLIFLVKRHQQENNTVIFVSHNFNIVRNLADYVLMIIEGKLSLKISREQMEKDENLVRFVEKGIAS